MSRKAQCRIRQNISFRQDEKSNYFFIPKQYTLKLIVNKQALWKSYKKKKKQTLFTDIIEIKNDIAREVYQGSKEISETTLAHLPLVMYPTWFINSWYIEETQEKTQKRWANSKVQVTKRNKQNDQKFTQEKV